MKNTLYYINPQQFTVKNIENSQALVLLFLSLLAFLLACFLLHSRACAIFYFKSNILIIA